MSQTEVQASEQSSVAPPNAVGGTQSPIVGAALHYASLGWHVLPLADKGKVPRIAKWQENATTDEETIIAWWEQWPNANVGVQLGPRSGIIDVEFDTEEGRATADKLLKESFTPTYKSARSVHRIFKYTDDLPAVTKIDRYGLEIRIGADPGGKGLQSVFPPSVHTTGAKYEWLPGLSPNEVDPMELPESLRTLLYNDPAGEALEPETGKAKPKEHWDRVIAGVGEGERNTAMASWFGKMLRNLTELNDQNLGLLYETGQAINQQHKPPLPEDELKRIFDSIMKLEQRRRAVCAVSGVLGGQGEDDGEGVRLVIVKSDPPRYELFSPMFKKAPGGCIVLTAEQMNSTRAIKIEALKQAECALPREFDKDWTRHGGLYATLVANADHRQAPMEEHRRLVVAQQFADAISQPTLAKAGDKLRAKPRNPYQSEDGSVLFSFEQMHDKLGRTADRIKRPELCQLLERIGVEWHYQGKQRFKRLSPEALRTLDGLINGTVPWNQSEQPSIRDVFRDSEKTTCVVRESSQATAV